jgi:protocatechuate 3,4-dioxygenase beta subunit
MHSDDEPITRRGSLVKLGGLVAAAAAGGWTAAAAAGASEETTGTGPAGVASGVVSCVLTPEQTEGPYYIPNEKVRRTLTEGKPGTPLLLRLGVVDASTCKPVNDAAVDIWHCDAGGVYSGFASGGGALGGGSQPTDKRTFLRGIQRTDAGGVATFQTIYPGWYPGRTVHIHVKVHLGGTVVHTGQLYFSDAMTDAVYRKAPYSSRPGRTTRNANDSVYRNGGVRSVLRLRKGATGYTGAITMGVARP